MLLLGIEIQPPVRVVKKETVSREGPILSFIREWKPILPRPKLFGAIYVYGVGEVNSDIEKKIAAKKEEWRMKGYSEQLIKMAEELAREWAAKMSEVFAPPEVRAVVLKYNIDKALDMADRWIEKMGK